MIPTKITFKTVRDTYEEVLSDDYEFDYEYYARIIHDIIFARHFNRHTVPEIEHYTGVDGDIMYLVLYRYVHDHEFRCKINEQFEGEWYSHVEKE